MLTLLIILAILFIIALFYRPVGRGRGYSSYSPAGLLLLILVVLLILYLLNVI